MKILHVSTHDVWGGAAIAANRLHTGLRTVGEASTMFVAHRTGDGGGVLTFVPPRDLRSRVVRSLRRKSLERELDRYAKSRPADAELFSDDRSQHLGEPLRQMPSCDVLHLHWMSEFLDCRSLFDWIPGRMPVVWTLHDMNIFTGGCHFDAGCHKHRAKCGACPKLGSANEDDLSRQVWNRRQGAYSRMSSTQLQLVAPSRWMADEVRQSALLGRFPVAVIPHGLDLEAFAPRDRTFARDALGIPQTAKVLIFAAHSLGERRKGLQLLIEALAGLSDDRDLFLLVVGRHGVAEQSGIRCRSLGYVSNERLLSIAYSAADLCVVPTLQDAMPMIVIESMACGTPVVGFPVGCLPDIVRDDLNGLVVTQQDSQALRDGIRGLFARPETLTEMRPKCRETAVEGYSLEILARRHISLYQQLMARN
jgi:glycosyltransferase involved in cell wall biosynthesis